MIQLVIFDLDGTLLNTLEDLWCAMNTALTYYHYPRHTLADCQKFVGNGIYKLVERSLPESKRQKEEVLKVKKQFDAYYNKHNRDLTKPYEGIEWLLAHLKAEQINCGVVTNKAHDYAKALTQYYFKDKISLTLGQREGIPTKPHPQSVQEMMDYFKVMPEHCLYVGDSEVDIETAKAAGLRSVGVSWGFRTAEVLKTAGADYVVDDAEALWSVIKSYKYQ